MIQAASVDTGVYGEVIHQVCGIPSRRSDE